MNCIDVTNLKSSIEKGEAPLIIDVRSPAEYRGSHISSARNIPLDRLSSESLEELPTKENTVVLVCQSGGRSEKAREKLHSLGYSNAVSVEGGMNAWEDGNFPIQSSGRTISIERQVRIAAGSIVVLGVVLGVLINIWFVAISAFVGAGLVFAGITDTCGMGMMLSRMPWNQ